MKTLIRNKKDNDKDSVFRDCQLIFLNINLRRKEIIWFSSVILLNTTVIGLPLRH